MASVHVHPQRTAKGIGDFLKAVCKKCPDKSIKRDRYVLHLIQEIEELTPVYFESWETYHQGAQKNRSFLNLRRDVIADLKTTLRDFWSALTRRTRRMKHPDYILGEFRKPQFKESLANINRAEDLIFVANTFVRGEAVLVQKGYPPMANPSVKEVEELLELVQLADVDTNANLEFYAHQKAFQVNMAQGIRLHRLLNQALQINFADVKDSELRRIMREHGFILVGEGGDDGDVVADVEATLNGDETEVESPESIAAMEVNAIASGEMAALEASIDAEVLAETNLNQAEEPPLFANE